MVVPCAKSGLSLHINILSPANIVMLSMHHLNQMLLWYDEVIICH